MNMKQSEKLQEEIKRLEKLCKLRFEQGKVCERLKWEERVEKIKFELFGLVYNGDCRRCTQNMKKIKRIDKICEGKNET